MKFAIIFGRRAAENLRWSAYSFTFFRPNVRYGWFPFSLYACSIGAALKRRLFSQDEAPEIRGTDEGGGREGKKRDCSFLVPPPLPPRLLLLRCCFSVLPWADGGEKEGFFLHTQSPPKQTPTQSLVLLLGSLVKRPAASHGNGGVEIGRGKNGILVAKSLDCISGADFLFRCKACVYTYCAQSTASLMYVRSSC